MEKNVGIIGLGRVGMVAAEKYISEGYRVFGYARRPEVIAKFQELGGVHLESPAQVASAVSTVIILVLNDRQVMDVVTGERGILEGAREDSLVICMSTINRGNLEGVAEQCAEKGVDFTDCPFTGGPGRVTTGTLTLIMAASPEAVKRSRPVLEVIGAITLVGDRPGMGQAVKYCNQLLVTAIHGATMELITLARKTGADPKQVCEVVGSGIAGNDYFRLLSKSILEGAPSPGGLGQLWKDVNIVVTTAREHNLPLLVTFATAHYFNMGVAQNMENEDASRLIEVLQKMISP
jgi:3-hydroxyisobutyrate dehydrogenase-like beta-hydroxyacid dehydrogenase